MTAFVGIGLVGLAGLLFLGYSLASIALPLDGPVQQYYVWAAKPGIVTGAVLLAMATGSAVWLSLPRWRRSPLRGLAVGFVVFLVAGGSCVVVTYERLTPRGSLLAAVGKLTPPAGVTHEQTTYGLVPVDGELIADGDDSSGRSSGAVRSWEMPPTPNACAQAKRIAKAWADPGSVSPVFLQPEESGSWACEWYARKDGWQALAAVLHEPGPSRSGDYFVVQVGEPGLWCCTLARPSQCCN